MDSEEVKQTKGENKNVVKKIRYKEFVDVLFNKKMIRHNMNIKEFTVNCIELELMMFLKFHCLLLMIKDIY